MSITLATIGAFLGKGLAIAGGMTIAKTVTNAISGITSRILPYEKSGEAKKWHTKLQLIASNKSLPNNSRSR